MEKPFENIQLSAKAFWDIDMTKLDYEKQGLYIIRKVFEHGSWNDILEVVVFYGKERTKEVLTTATCLKEATVYFAARFFNTPITNFKCYTSKQYRPVSASSR